MTASESREITEACGARVVRAARKSRALRSLFQICHIDRLAEEYAACWFETEDPVEKRRLWAEYRREIKRALLSPLWRHGSLAIAFHAVFEHPMYALPIMGVTLWIVIRQLMK